MKKAEPTPGNLRFEDAMARLDAIVSGMESGKIGIEELIEKYAEAMALKAHCQKILDQAELRIRRIQEAADGTIQAEEFTPDAARPGEET